MDLEVLELRVLRHACVAGSAGRWARWRGERWRSVPSDSVVFRYLERFHDAGREAHRAFDALKGLGKVNAGLVDCRAVLIPRPRWTWTRLVESHKKEALYSEVQGASRPTGQRPTWWCIGVSGNVPAGHHSSSVEGGSGTSACWGGQGHALTRRSRSLPAPRAETRGSESGRG